jgi:hypothetical protein
MTPARIQSLVCFRMDYYGVTWEERLSELADYRNINGHCNVPTNTASTQALYLSLQRNTYRLLLEGKRSQMTPARIQSLVGLVGTAMASPGKNV